MHRHTGRENICFHRFNFHIEENVHEVIAFLICRLLFFFFSSAETNPKSLGLLSSISAMGQGAQALGCFGKCMDSCSSNTNVGREMPAPHPHCSAVWVLKTPQKPQVSASCESVLPSVLPEWPYIYTNRFEYAFLPPHPSKISILYTIFCTLLFSVRSSRTF